MLSVNCKACQKTMNVPEKFAGRKGKCKNCKAPILVPKLVVEEEFEEVDEFLDEEDDYGFDDVDMEEVDDFESRSTAALPQRSRSQASRQKTEESTSGPNYIQPKQYKEQSRFETGFIVKCVAGFLAFVACTSVVIIFITQVNKGYDPLKRAKTTEGVDQRSAVLQRDLQVQEQGNGGVGVQKNQRKVGVKKLDVGRPVLFQPVKGFGGAAPPKRNGNGK